MAAPRMAWIRTAAWVVTDLPVQLHRHGEAISYLNQRGLHSPELIEEMRIGYAPGNCLRCWLTQLGYPLQSQREPAWSLPPALRPTSIGSSSRWKVTSMAGPLDLRAAASVSAGRQRWLVRLGPGPAIFW